jgi:hypothetical protein
MTGPTIHPPRGYDSIKPLRSHTGEPLHDEPENCQECCPACRVPCTAYLEAAWWNDDQVPERRSP